MRTSFFVTLIILICFGCSNHDKTTGSSESMGTLSMSNGYVNQLSDNVLVPYLNNQANVEIEATDNEEYEESSLCKYNYKNGSYYNYDISGHDEDGNYVSGNVDIDEYGEGYIEDDFGNEKYIEVKWVGYGVMEGYDEDGIYYELNVE